MAKRVTGLGRGLEALLPADDLSNRLEQMKKNVCADWHEEGEHAAAGDQQAVAGEAHKLVGTQIQELPLASICASDGQPRKYFDELTISELAQSIFEHGLLSPILVVPLSEPELAKDDVEYRIIAGERRFRACQVLKWQRIPAIVKAVSEVEHFELALIENIQREDLTPIDEALAYEHLLRISGLSQNEMAKRLGKGRSALANSLRLLQLPPAVQEGLTQGQIRSGHAKALLMIKDTARLLEAYERCVAESWTVRQVERYGLQWNQAEPAARSKAPDLGVEILAPEAGPEAEVPPKKAPQTLSPRIQKEPATPAANAKKSHLGDATGGSGDTLPDQNRLDTEHWRVYDMLFSIKELEIHLAEALHLNLELRLQGNLSEMRNEMQSGEQLANSSVRPRRALLQVEFDSPEQWEQWLSKLGLDQVIGDGKKPQDSNQRALFS